MRRLAAVYLAAAAAPLVAAACGGSPTTNDAVRVGALVAFTGESAAIGFNLERGALMAVDRMNAAGGVANRPVEVIFRDTRSDPQRAIEAAQELVAEGVVGVIGPGGDEAALPVRPVLAEAGVVLVSPESGAELPANDGNRPPWFRLAPSPAVYGESLAKAAVDAGSTRLGIVSAPSAFHRAFAAAAAARLRSLGAEVAFEAELDDTASSVAGLADQVAAASGDGVDGIVLALDPLPAARLVNDVTVVAAGGSRQWFLSPRLKTDVFIANCDVAAVEGAVGVAPDIFLGGSEAFVEAFTDAWNGDTPFESTQFVYDAMALLLLGLDRIGQGTADTQDGLAEAIFAAASVGGLVIEWDDLALARERNADGGELQYVGVTGPILLDPDGLRRTGTVATWSITGGTIGDVP